jgi:hypothetical protein
MNGADIGMVQGGGGLRFTLKSAQRLRISGHFIGQELQGHKPVQARVLRLVDYTHAATAQLFNDAVVRDGLT